MKSYKAAAATLILVLAFGANAVQVRDGAPFTGGAKPQTNSAIAPDTVDRGGTIRQVDMKKRQMIVDGVPYAIPLTANINYAAKHGSPAANELKPGNQITFKTSRSRSGASDDVAQITVTGHDRRADKR